MLFGVGRGVWFHSQALGQESWGMRLGGCSCAAYRLKVENLQAMDCTSVSRIRSKWICTRTPPNLFVQLCTTEHGQWQYVSCSGSFHLGTRLGRGKLV